MQNLAELDNAIARVERCLKLSRECGFDGLAAAIREDIRKEIIPATLVLAAAAGAPARTTITLRYRKLAKMLAAECPGDAALDITEFEALAPGRWRPAPYRRAKDPSQATARMPASPAQAGQG